MTLYGRSFLTLLDFTPEEIRYLLDLSKRLKREKHLRIGHRHLMGRNIVLLFEKTSTRTRCAFEVAGRDLGMGVTFLDPASSQMGKKESIKDTARVLGRMYDGIEYRGFSQNTVEALAKYSGVPVWNGLTDQFHPTQMLADLLTIDERFKRIEGVRLTFMGDARNNVANSLMVACAKMGMHFAACAPEALFPAPELVAAARETAEKTGGSVTLTSDVQEGTSGADVLYTDIWVSMGEPESVWKERIELLLPYQVSAASFENAAEGAIFMHCLPSYHDLGTQIGQEIYEKFGLTQMEVTDDVFESERSAVFDEAENRLHTIKAVILATLSKQ